MRRSTRPNLASLQALTSPVSHTSPGVAATADSRRRGTGKALRAVSAACFALASLFATPGCDVKSFIDPAELGRYEHQPLLLPILRKLDTGIEEPNDEWANATDPVPADLVSTTADYVIGPGDALSISVSDLQGPGSEQARVYRVTDSGMVSLPLLPEELKAADLTEAQLQKTIKKAYKDANLLSDANVTVVVVEARGRTFSILGAVGNPGEFAIQKKDFRLLDALVIARDAASGPGVDYAYVYRKETGPLPEPPPAPGTALPEAPPTTTPGPDILAPKSDATPRRQPAQDVRAAYARRQAWRIDLLQPRMVQTAAPSNAPSDSGAIRIEPSPSAPAPTPTLPPSPEPAAPPTPPAPTAEAPATPDGRYIILDGKPVLVGGATQPSTAPAAAEATPAAPENTAATQPFAFKDLPNPTGDRVIRVPLSQLRNGEFQYNIVIRPNDVIFVPPPKSGFYYMGGHVQRVGTYSLSGTRVTLKQAIISAGMLDQVAIPQRTDIVRRIGSDREVFARVDLDAIFEGRQPDLFLKPDDTVMVGTNFFAPFIAQIRNGFRLSYGFGFFLDRNFEREVFGDRGNGNNN